MSFKESIKQMRLVCKGSDVRAVAQAVGCTMQTVRNAMRREDVFLVTETEAKCLLEMKKRTAPRLKALRSFEKSVTA